MARITQEVHNLKSRCKATVWHYLNTIEDPSVQNDEDYSSVSYTYTNTLGSENPVVSFQYQKSMDGNPGEFQLVLKSNKNLMAQIVPGDWIAIYLTQGADQTIAESSNVSSTANDDSSTPQPYVIASSTNSNSSGVVQGPGASKTYYWTPYQYQQFREQTDVISWSANIIALADDFDQKIQNGQVAAVGQTSQAGAQSTDTSENWSLRCLGNINTITRSETLDGIGKKSVQWIISGFDFGKVFAHTTVFLNSFWAETNFMITDISSAMQSVGDSGSIMNTPSGWLEGILKLILGPQSSGVRNARLSEQWHLPDSMLSDLGFNSVPKSSAGGVYSGNSGENLFYDMLVRYYPNELSGLKITSQFPSMISLWEFMVDFSHSNVNELFYEIDDVNSSGTPTLYCRMFPYAFKNYKDASGGIDDDLISKFLDLPEVDVDYSYITNMDVSLNDHTRSNLFFIPSTMDAKNMTENLAISLQDDADILTMGNSIRKYGTHVRGAADEFSMADQKSMAVQLMVGINLLTKHWFMNNHNFMSGSVTMPGHPLMRIGKRLAIYPGESDHQLPQHYYIQQYMDQWSFPGIWIQTVGVARGIYVDGNTEVFANSVDTGDTFIIGGSTLTGLQR